MGLIRLFLALVVVADHARMVALSPVGLVFSGYLKLGLSGPSAVMCFYVVSGFLISYALNHKYHNNYYGNLAFYKSRFVRIFSVYWPLFFIFIYFDFWGGRAVISTSLSLACGSVLIGADWFVSGDYWGCFPSALTPAWSLGAELAFYAMAPFLLRNFTVAISVLLCSVLLRCVALFLVGEVNEWTYYFLPSTICFFLLGHFARLAHDRSKLPIILSLILLVMSGYLSMPSAINTSWQTWHFYLAIICFAVALPGVFAATKSSMLLTWVGDLSFPLYLIHMSVIHALYDPSSFAFPIGKAILRFGKAFADPQDGGALVTGMIAVLCIAAAIAVHYLIERPFGNVLKIIMFRGLKLSENIRNSLVK
jgi:peptidoglycan/LPS O-acetylase OafA/YrhL